MRLIPEPTYMHKTPGTFSFPDTPAVAFRGDSFVAERVIAHTTGGRPVADCGERADIVIGQTMDVLPALPAEVQAKADDCVRSAEGYALVTEPERVCIAAGTEPAAIHALMTLAQLRRIHGDKIPCGIILDKPVNKRRGVQICLAQGKLAYRRDYFHYLIPRLAEWKFNEIYLYLETYFDFPSFPGLGGPGAMTVDDAKDLDALCRDYGIMLVPTTNLLGHCGDLLATERFSHLAEYPAGTDRRTVNPYNVCASSEEIHRVVDRLLDDLMDAFSAGLIQVGGDEVSRIGVCPTCVARGLHPLDVYVEFFARLADRVESRGRRAAIWGDMMLRYVEELGEASFREKTAPIRNRVLVGDWHYTGGSRKTLELFARQGFQTVALKSNHWWRCFAVYPGHGDSQLQLFGDNEAAGTSGGLTSDWTTAAGLHREHLSYLDATGGLILWSGVERASKVIDEVEAAFPFHQYGVKSDHLSRLIHLVGDLDGPLLQIFAPNHGIDLRKCLYHSTNVLDFWFYYSGRLLNGGIERAEALVGQARELWKSMVAAGTVDAHPYLWCYEGPVLTLEHLLKRYRVTEEAYNAYHNAAVSDNDDAEVFESSLRLAAAGLRKHVDDFPPVIAYVKRLTDQLGSERSTHQRLRATIEGIERLAGFLEAMTKWAWPLPAFQSLRKVLMDYERTNWWMNRENDWADMPHPFSRFSVQSETQWGAIPIETGHDGVVIGGDAL